MLIEVDEGPSDNRTEQAAWIIEHHNQPWEIADACHKAAVRQAPTLAAVLKQRPPDLGVEDLKWDATLWLEGHATYDQLLDIARYRYLAGGFPEDDNYSSYQDPRFGARERLIDVLVRKLPLDELAYYWDGVGDASSTDLTDEEWDLLAPLLPPAGKHGLSQRQAVNGMLYLYAHRGESLSRWPLRYGKRVMRYIQQSQYRRDGVFAHMLASLEGKPEAARITAWLQSELRPRSNVHG